MTEPDPNQPAVVSVEHFSKSFGATRALRDVSLDLREGEIHALVGQNGAGKSTLFKILSGYHAPAPGAELKVRGADVRLPLRPSEVSRLGFSFVHQNLGLVGTASVVENMRIASFKTRAFGPINWRAEERKVDRALSEFGVDINPRALASSLVPAEQAIVAIVRATQVREERSTLLVLDEPTVYLDASDKARLFAVVRQLASSGAAVLLSTHRLDEAMQIADRISVLRE